MVQLHAYVLQLEPKMWQLNKIVVPLVMAHWTDIAYSSLHYDIPKVKSIQVKHTNNPKDCCKELFTDWLTTDNGIDPKTWKTLLNQLNEVEELVATVEQIKVCTNFRFVEK